MSYRPPRPEERTGWQGRWTGSRRIGRGVSRFHHLAQGGWGLPRLWRRRTRPSCAVDAGREHSSGRPFACRCRVPSRACPVCPSVYPCLSRQRLSRTRAVLHRGVRMCTLALEPTRNEKEMPLVGAVRGVQQVAHDLGSAQGGSLVPLDPSPRGGRACEVPILLLRASLRC